MTETAATPSDKQFDLAVRKLERIQDEIDNVIYGQKEIVAQALTGILANGHIMLIGVPGLAKTLLVETLGTVLGLNNKRIQCTPDLMPSDIIGTEILEGTATKKSFRFVEGPVFTNLLMADEINRASPRTQSALLQAMQEKTVSVSGHTYTLPAPFHVLATRNPLEQEGTYPLPEAQLDRFILQIHVGYPDKETERMILVKTTGAEKSVAEQVITLEDLTAMQDLVKAIPIGENFVDKVVKLVRLARPDTTHIENVKKFVNWAPGPRAGQSLIMAAKAHALLRGRMAPDSSDLEALAFAVFNHRMALNYAAQAEGVTLSSLVRELLDESLK